MTSSIHRVKEELGRIRPSKHCCQVAELSALLHMDGTYAIRSGGHMLVTESSGVYTARKIYTLLHTLFDLETPVVKVTRSTPRRGTVYRLEIHDQPGFHQILNELGVLDSSLSPERVVPRRITKNYCCAAAALRGAFLGGGYVSEPFGAADLEVAFSSREAAAAFKDLFERRGFTPGIRERRGQWVLYLKKRQQISDFLAVAGAHGAHLDWESRTIMNTTRNSVNRLVNCDSANARRLAEASHHQREVVSRLMGLGLLDAAPEPLRDTAFARIEHPQASLAELGRLLDPPVSKAVVQGRMRRLESMLPPT
ncbi:MAG: DNA-binding protein WhiA [Candidatus Geothermincolia bacterium]